MKENIELSSDLYQLYKPGADRSVYLGIIRT